MDGSTFSDLGGAVSSIFGGIGDLAEGQAYSKAAQYAGDNAEIEQQSTAIKEFQATRNIVQSTGATQSQVAGAGFKLSGSSLSVLKGSAAQGSLTKNLINAQGEIDVNGYKQQQAQFQGMAAAANSAGAGGIFGGILKGIGAIASFI